MGRVTPRAHAVVTVDQETPNGTIIETSIEGVAVALIRHAEGWSAAYDSCTHARCRLSRKGEIVDGTTLVCNCHGSEFDARTGDVLLEPAELPLQMLDVELPADGATVRVFGEPEGEPTR